MFRTSDNQFLCKLIITFQQICFCCVNSEEACDMASKEAAEETVSFESAADLRRWFEERRTRSLPKTRETVPAPAVLTEVSVYIVRNLCRP